MSKMVFFDLETGGLDPKSHPIIQFAACATEDWEIVDELEIKIDFKEGDCTPDALKMNSYNPLTWAEEAIRPGLAVSRVSGFFRKHAHLTIPKKSGKGDWYACQLAGHNAQKFDRRFLAELPFDDRDFIAEMFKHHDRFCVGSLSVWDTFQLAITYRMVRAQRNDYPDGPPRDLKLVTLAEFFGIKLEAHDALADVRANVEIAHKMFDYLEGSR